MNYFSFQYKLKEILSIHNQIYSINQIHTWKIEPGGNIAAFAAFKNQVVRVNFSKKLPMVQERKANKYILKINNLIH